MSIGAGLYDRPDDDDYETILLPNGLPILHLSDGEHTQTFIGWGQGLQWFTNLLHGYRFAQLLREYAQARMQETGSMPLNTWFAPDEVQAFIHGVAANN